jgi:AraC-like DNA-binding protein
MLLGMVWRCSTQLAAIWSRMHLGRWTENGIESIFVVCKSGRPYLQDMDILSDLFRDAGLRRRRLDVHTLPAHRAVRFPCDRSVGLHVCASGTVWIHTHNDPSPLKLQQGDIAIMARGCQHLLSASDTIRGLPVDEIGTVAATHPTFGQTASTLSGAYQLWNTPAHPFFAELPAFFVVRAAESPRLGPVALTVAMLTEELATTAFGRETILHGLLDVLFTQLVRAVIDANGAAGIGWSQAVREPRIRDAVTLLHTEHAANWTLDALASAVGMSRSALAERFRQTMGDTPLSYLRTVRMQRAMRLLSESTMTLEQVALAVGYQDAFGFSKAFKKSVGESPGEFRRRDASEQHLPWRLAATDAVGTG